VLQPTRTPFSELPRVKSNWQAGWGDCAAPQPTLGVDEKRLFKGPRRAFVSGWMAVFYVRPATARTSGGFTLKPITPTGTACCAAARFRRPRRLWTHANSDRPGPRLREAGRDRSGTPAGALKRSAQTNDRVPLASKPLGLNPKSFSKSLVPNDEQPCRLSTGCECPKGQR